MHCFPTIVFVIGGHRAGGRAATVARQWRMCSAVSSVEEDELIHREEVSNGADRDSATLDLY